MDKKTQNDLLKLVRDNYRTIAGDFDITRRKGLWPEVAKLADGVDCSLAKKSVLDAGCGQGRLYECFRDKNIDYLGVDSCAELVKLARDHYGERFEIGEILTLSQLPQFDFDYIFCVGVLHHLPGQKLQLEALNQLKSKAKTGGQIIISVWNIWAMPKLRPLIFKYAFLKLLGKHRMDWGDIIFYWRYSGGQIASRRYYHAFTKRGLKKLVKQADLLIDQIYKDKFNYYLILKKPLNS